MRNSKDDTWHLSASVNHEQEIRKLSTHQNKHQHGVQVTEVHNPADGDHDQQQVEPAASQEPPQCLCISLAWNPAYTTQESGGYQTAAEALSALRLR